MNELLTAAADAGDVMQLAGELKFSLAGDGPKRVEILAYTGGKIQFPQFQHPVVIELSGLDTNGKARPLLKDHNQSLIVGHTDSVQVRNGQLFAAGVISGAGAVAREVVEAAGNGFPWQASVGVLPVEARVIPRGKTVIVNGQAQAGPFIHVVKSQLKEISLVALGRDDNTAARIAASWSSAMTLEQFIRSLGFDPATLTAEQRENLEAQFKLQEPDAGGGGGGGGEAQPSALEAEEQRIIEIERLCAQHPTIAADAIREGWTAERTQLAVVRANRPVIAGVRRGRNDNRGQILAAALCLSTGMGEEFVGKQYGEQVTDQAMSRENREAASIHGLLFETIQAAGLRVRPGRVTTEVIETAFRAEQLLRASGFSSISLTGVLGDSMHKQLLGSYQAVPTVVPFITRSRDVNDFRAHKAYRVTGVGLLEQLGKNGEIKHMQLTESEYENQAKLFARMITLSYEDIINDDTGALMQVPQFLGRAAALTREGLVFDLLLDNTDNFFHSDNANYQEGAATALGIAGLTTAEQVFDEMVDADDRPILLQPKTLLVPSALKVTAQSLMKETRVVGNTDRLADNPHAGKWNPLSTPYLKSKPKEWYLFADPNEVAALEVAYLRGKREPSIERGDVNFNQLGMSWRCVWAIGAAKQDPNGAVKSKGEA